MNRFSRIRHHVDMKDVKKRHLEETAAKKLEEKRLKEEAEQIKAEYEKWKSNWRDDILDEGMTTQMLTGILPSAGDTDLEVIQTGLSGEGEIDYGEGGLGDEVMAGEGEYTCFSNLDAIQNADDPNSIGTALRLFDQDTKQFRNQAHGGGHHGYLPAIPGYVQGMMRNVKPSGDYNGYDKSRRQNKGLPLTQNGSDLYYHLYGQTNDQLGLGHGSWNSIDGVTSQGFGTVLRFDGPGSPRYIALKPVDSTGFDTIKIHASIADSSIVSTYRDSEFFGGTLRDKRLQVYYWAGDNPDYVSHPSASSTKLSVTGVGLVPTDGWRPINMKPNGELDDTVDPYIIKHTADRDTQGVDALGATYSTSGKLHGYSIPLPEYTRGKNARYLIIQVDKTNIPQDSFALASIRFQRKNTLRVPSLSKPLTDIEASPFVRVGPTKKNEGGKQRKKKVQNIIDSGLEYTGTKFSNDFPVRTRLESKLFEKLKDIRAEYIKWESDEKLDEGMTTQMLTGILPSAGNTDLDTLQLGATGSDLTYTPNTLDSVVDGEFTSLTNTDALDNVNDPHDMGTNIRTPQPTNQTTFTANDISHTGAAPNTFPPYKPGDTGGTRGVGISGQYNVMQDPSYRASQGPTNENIPVNDVNSFNGDKLYGDGGIVGTHTFWGQGAGAIAGFPRFAALKAVDTTEMDTLTMNWFMYGGYGVDTESGSPTEGETVTLTSSKFSQPGDGVVVYYWAGDKEGAKSFAPSVTGMSKTNDGWRPINVKPDGTTDNSYDPYLISHKPDGAFYNSGARQKHEGGYPSHVLLNNKITLPPWCRDKNTRFLLHQGTNSAGSNRANFGITSIRFQRQNAQTISVKLDSPEGSNFVRGGIIDGKATTPEERKKRVADILKLSSQYVTNKFGKGFPGQQTVTAGDSTFDTKRFNEETSIEEQTTFPQMQQRIRDAKEKRREQQKKSEKLYMDTKRKGVKFYDKKGTGRLKDGKKIYD